MNEKNESQKTRAKPENLPDEGNHRVVRENNSKDQEGMIKLSQGFPVKLHCMLSEIEKDGLEHIVSWQPHGRCFMVHNRQQFVARILNCWFSQTSFESFQRQLNLYGFKRLSSGLDKGAYYHEEFLRHQPIKAGLIKRRKLKGTGPRKASSPGTEPNFYRMSFLTKDAETGDNTKKLSIKQDPPKSERLISSLPLIQSPHNFESLQSRIHKKSANANNNSSELLSLISQGQTPQCILQPDLSYMASFLSNNDRSNTHHNSSNNTQPVQPQTMEGWNTALTGQLSRRPGDASLGMAQMGGNVANPPDDADDNSAEWGIYDDLF